jgi:HD-GYP domain-containing protein (c-di-GMP phosphodiesterase class II)
MMTLYASVFQADAPAALQMMAEAFAANSTFIEPLGNDRMVFAIPLQHNGSRAWFAVGRAWSKDIDSFRRLIYVATEAAKRRYQTEQLQSSLEFAERSIKETIQEKNWIRELSSYSIERSSASPTSLTNRILSQLAQIVNADAVAVVPVIHQAVQDIELSPATFGSQMWTLDDFSRLLQIVGPVTPGDLIVQNDRSYHLPGGICTACMVVQIGITAPRGHLVAINRRVHPGSPLRRASDIRFTSTEASILNEAAAFFESEAIQRNAMDESERLIIGTLRSMSSAIEARDPYTRGHSERVARLGYILAKKLDIAHEKCREIYVSGVLHDIGKIGIPDHVLLKPGRLEPEEIAVIQKHPIIGHHILSDIKRLEFALPGVLYHHEHWNGLGYPHELAGEDIPLMARVLAVADSFDAMTSSRPYRSAMLVENACSVLAKGAGHQWDRDVCRVFESWIFGREIHENEEDPMGLLNGEFDFQKDYGGHFVKNGSAA